MFANRQPPHARRRLSSSEIPALALLALALVLAPAATRAGATAPLSYPAPGGFDLHVSINGDDTNPGTRWSAPLRSIQRALELARPGQRVGVTAGEYYEDLRSVRDGRADAPISVVGAAGAVVRGAGDARVIEIRHSYLALVNLEVDGKVTDASGRTTYRDKLIYIMGRSQRPGLTGVRLLHMRIRNAGGECVRMKYFAHHNEVAYSSISSCGVDDFHGDGKAKNGEGIYIGTAPEQLHRNPSGKLDGSNGNWIHHNRFDTRGNECVDIKEASRFNLVEYNSCTGQLDEDAAGISSRGNDNIVRFNHIWGNRGAGVRFGGDTEQDGIDNHAYGNILRDNAYSAFKIMASPQRMICGNQIAPGKPPVVRGTFAKSVQPAAACQ